ALELGVGTGRVALDLARRGRPVCGIDISPKMLAVLDQKKGGLAVETHLGDMADCAIEGPFELVYVVASTFFSLTEQSRQVDCFLNVARVLSPTGAFVVQSFVPSPAILRPGRNLILRKLTRDGVQLSAMDTDMSTQEIAYQEVSMCEGSLEFLPVAQRYCWPSELDLMARLAGMRLVERWGDFDRSAFTRQSPAHVSVYRLGE
ncbi:MAG: class I SAM-dependent DNA methyltransferase, partial [Actinomycetota bacterium]